jgi:hypothetical protein
VRLIGAVGGVVVARIRRLVHKSNGLADVGETSGEYVRRYGGVRFCRRFGSRVNARSEASGADDQVDGLANAVDERHLSLLVAAAWAGAGGEGRCSVAVARGWGLVRGAVAALASRGAVRAAGEGPHRRAHPALALRTSTLLVKALFVFVCFNVSEEELRDAFSGNVRRDFSRQCRLDAASGGLATHWFVVLEDVHLIGDLAASEFLRGQGGVAAVSSGRRRGALLGR